jgi:hypothetical protein
LKLGEQYRGGLSGGRRAADTVGAGSEEFGTDGRKANGEWDKGARGLRTGGQKSLAEVWGASKASTTAKKSSQEEVGSKCSELLQDVDEDCLKGMPLYHSKYLLADLKGHTQPLIHILTIYRTYLFLRQNRTRAEHY